MKEVKYVFHRSFCIIIDDGLNTTHKMHDKEKYDDDVVSWILEDGDADEFTDGYVLNKGDCLTIHIKPELNNDKTIDFIKDYFVAEADDSWKIKVA